MRIGMILDTDFPPDPRVEREALALVNNGHEVFLLCLNFTNKKKREIYKKIQIIRHDLPKFVYNKIRPLVVNYPFYNKFWFSKIDNFIQENQLDVLHVHDLPLMPVSINIAKKRNIKIVGDFHENFAEAIKIYDWANTIRGRLFLNFKKYEEAQRHTVSNLDKIIVCASETVDIFSGQYNRSPQDFYVVENTIDIEQFMTSGIDTTLDKQLKTKYKDSIVFGYVGVVIPNRGLQHFIKLLPELSELKLKLVVVGKGKLIQEFKSFIKRHNLDHMVDWYGWQSFDKIITFINNFDVGLTRLERNIQNDTTTANKLFQYMYMGKPVLTSNSLPMHRFVEETQAGLIHQSGDQNHLKQNIMQLYHDKNLREQMGKNGEKIVREKYNWENTSRNLIKLYENFKN